VFPGDAVRAAKHHLSVSERHFRGIHSKDGGSSLEYSVASQLVYATGLHADECREHDSETLPHLLTRNVDAAFKKRARVLSGAFEKGIRNAAKIANISWRGACNGEFIRSVPGTVGQEWHLDMMEGNYGAASPIAGDGGYIAMTLLAKCKQGYVDFPANLEPGAIPKNWARLQPYDVEWQLGDILIFRLNQIHRGPPNNTKLNRDIFFMAEKSVNNIHSNSSVITNEVFNDARAATTR
jgi:hypothetical protein